MAKSVVTKAEVLQAMAYFKTLMDAYNDDTFARKGEGGGDVSALESKIDDIQSSIADLQTNIENIDYSSSSSTGEDTSRLKSKLDTLESDVEMLKNLLELDADVDDLKRKIKELEAETDDETITYADVAGLFN